MERPIVFGSFAMLQEMVVSFQPQQTVFIYQKVPIKTARNKREIELRGSTRVIPFLIERRQKYGKVNILFLIWETLFKGLVELTVVCFVWKMVR